MSTYLITVITVSICVGVCNIISPHLTSISKYSKMIGMLVVLCVIISPLKEVMNIFNENGFEGIKDDLLNFDEDDQSKYDEIFKDYLNSFSAEEVKTAMENILLEEFEIPSDECDISIYTEYREGKLCPSDVQILLSGKSIFKNPYIIEEHFEKLLGCSTRVLIK